ncbi:NAD(P)-binding protein [Multifurca ochricompacta]|uniref:NAD(P)-binding protein n=1 Tax=Multifurca ochricompacta TaxID=376703 RepID=A0AAD4M357_9AGAM|nr:NAD(P)-binding protein [Multifurca ochricompacta]
MASWIGIIKHRANVGYKDRAQTLRGRPQSKQKKPERVVGNMAPVVNPRFIFTNTIKLGALPELGKTAVYDTSDTIDLDTIALDGGFLAKTLLLGIDPYMTRVKFRDPAIKLYNPAFELGKPLYSYGVAVVLRSENNSFKPGDHLFSQKIPHEQYWVRADSSAFTVIKNDLGLPWTTYVGVLGMPGQTAYVGWKQFSKAKKGDIVFVSAAAGGVGSIVLQLAKRDGCRVIASAGTDEKVAWLRSLGADVVFNYKTEDMRTVLLREGPIDVWIKSYWDNVGGETLDLAFETARERARFIECGMSSTQGENPYRLKNQTAIIRKELSLNGFLVNNWLGEYGEAFYEEFPKLVKSGELKYEEDIVYGLEKVGEAILEVGKGLNRAKKVVIVANE